jgi:tRNA(adenine34) deaminase
MRASDEHYMSLAVEEAAHARGRGDMPFGAVIVDETSGTVVARAHSTELTESDVTAHAELKAIRDASSKLSRLELQGITLFATAEPCAMCASAIFHAKIDRVVIASTREDLPFKFRPRKIRFSQLADDCGYEVDVVTGVLGQHVPKLFEGARPGVKAA